jgi:hypothetical protein
MEMSRRKFALGIGASCSLGLISRLSAEASSPAMTVEQTQATIAGFASALLGGGKYESYFADDVVVSLVGSGRQVKGVIPAREAINLLHHEEFNAQPMIKTLVVGPGQAALEADFIGVQTSTFADIPNTGRQVEIPYCAFYQLEDNKITSVSIYGLFDELMRQLSRPAPTNGHKGVGPIPPD